LIAATVTPGKHAVVIVDRAAWHVTGKLLIPVNLSILPLPPYSPELNPVEQIWQQLRQSDWANRCFNRLLEVSETNMKINLDQQVLEAA
jgi:transposase